MKLNSSEGHRVINKIINKDVFSAFVLNHFVFKFSSELNFAER